MIGVSEDVCICMYVHVSVEYVVDMRQIIVCLIPLVEIRKFVDWLELKFCSELKKRLNCNLPCQ